MMKHPVDEMHPDYQYAMKLAIEMLAEMVTEGRDIEQVHHAFVMVGITRLIDIQGLAKTIAILQGTVEGMQQESFGQEKH